MNTILLLLVVLPAQPAPGKNPLVSTQGNQPARVGKVLLLENERTIEGEVERYPDFYRVRRSVGETQIPTHQVLALCADYKEAFEFLKRRTNLSDADERFKLAEWAQNRGLLAEAMEESQAALQLRPAHEPTKRLKLVIEQMERREREKKLFPDKQPVNLAHSDGIAPLPFEVSTDALGVFCQKIQPLLMNSCASCHATGKGGNFKLVRVYSGSNTNKRVLQNNLAAVLAQISPNQVGASPILVKSVSVHGDLTQAPLHNRSNQAFRMLDEWIRYTVANSHFDPTMPSPASLAAVAIPNTAPIQVAIPASAKAGAVPASGAVIPAGASLTNKASEFASGMGDSADKSAASSADKPGSPSEKPGSEPAKASEPVSAGAKATPKGPVDPYDPDGFNQGSKPPEKPAPSP